MSKKNKINVHNCKNGSFSEQILATVRILLRYPHKYGEILPNFNKYSKMFTNVRYTNKC